MVIILSSLFSLSFASQRERETVEIVGGAVERLLDQLEPLFGVKLAPGLVAAPRARRAGQRPFDGGIHGGRTIAVAISHGTRPFFVICRRRVGAGGECLRARRRLSFIYVLWPTFANQRLDRIDKPAL